MAPQPGRRRQRADLESDDEDSMRASERSSPASNFPKRARTESDSDSEEEINHMNSPRGVQHTPEDADEDGYSDDNSSPSKFQPGAIIRVKLTNFVTYENAEFFPGPNLNMVIGPNGTGKSSLVCAICLGLGWGPQHLGRAGQVGEFVKHGKPDAFIEIELQRRPSEASNYVVRLRIIRDGNAREWWLNGKKTSLKAVSSLTKSLSIQIDNLCQFLPQDKVSEFAALSPVELLQQTQRAAAPEEMLEMHESLKKYRKEQKALETQLEADRHTLDNHENRQQNLQSEVDRLRERQKVLERIDILQKMLPFLEYKITLAQYNDFKARKVQAKERYQEFTRSIAPNLESITHKKDYQRQIESVVRERKRTLQNAEAEVARQEAKLASLEAEMNDHEQNVQADRTGEKNRRHEITSIMTKIRSLQAQLNGPPIEFNPAEWNERTRAKEHEIRDLSTQIGELDTENRQISAAGKTLRETIDATKQELASFDTQEGQQMSKLERFSRDTARAWKWVQDNRDKFEKEVYGPPVISCSVIDSRYTNALESLIHQSDFMALTVQTLNDMKTLSNQAHEVMNLSITIKSNEVQGQNRRPLSKQELDEIGMDGYAIDFLDGPGPVLAMLNEAARLDICPVTLRDISEQQYNMIVRKNLTSWVTATQSFQVTRRAEYGPSATSTNTRELKHAKYWTDQPVDTSARREIEERLESLEAEFVAMKDVILPLRQKIKSLKEERDDMQKSIDQIKKEKAELQTAYSKRQAIPDRIAQEETILKEKEAGIEELRQQRETSRAQADLLAIRRTKQTLLLKDLIVNIRKCHEELLDAQIRFIEAESDVTGLEERNQDLVKQQNDEEALMKQAEAEATRTKTLASAALKVCKQLIEIHGHGDDGDGTVDLFSKPPDDATIESLQIEIAAEESKLDFIHANNPNAIRDFEHRQSLIDELQKKITDTETRLEKINKRIARTRGEWEPRLDELIAQISEAFAFNFEQIGCAGEVSVHKADDFEQWSIQIKVKFRENETLQILDQHRQSGGERSVSTIFYLMSLQSMARAPFRVVDEINQGMDPRNERMVHERMVEIACKEHTSQYFLITPKLLTGLRYDKRMKVLCIASGEHMPEDYRRLDVSKIIGMRRAIMAAA